MKCRRSLFELEAASGAAAAAAAALRTRSDTSWKLHRVPLCLLSPSLARRRPLLAPRCSPSRHTLGVETHGSAQRQRWSPLGFRTEWGLEGGGGLEVARQILPPLSRTDAWSGQRAASLRCGAPISAHVLKIPVIRLTPWRQGGSSSNCGAGRGDVYPRGICAGCCCHGNAVIFFIFFGGCCCCLDLRMLLGKKIISTPLPHNFFLSQIEFLCRYLPCGTHDTNRIKYVSKKKLTQ